ncbi:MAG: hypothetical protein EHM32_01675 [Spirochaetales bacterium]|nr:MAG: hypothetical protein EHM32_01675 [Spirochaetales bacterium]
MPRRRIPAAQHVAKGTYRRDRHEEAPIDLPVELNAVTPSPIVPPSVRSEWGIVVRRLLEVGILIDADVHFLEEAFVLLADARYFHELIESIKKDLAKLEKAKPAKGLTISDIIQAKAAAMAALVSVNGMHVKSLSLFTSIISRFGISPSERARILHLLPKKPPGDKKKSIKGIIEAAR